jgi:hypothetical protein
MLYALHSTLYTPSTLYTIHPTPYKSSFLENQLTVRPPPNPHSHSHSHSHLRTLSFSPSHTPLPSLLHSFTPSFCHFHIFAFFTKHTSPSSGKSACTQSLPSPTPFRQRHIHVMWGASASRISVLFIIINFH